MRNIAQSSTALGQGKLFSRFLDTVGNGTGIANANGEYGVDLGNATFDVAGGAEDDLWSLAAHGLVTGQPIYFDAIGTGCTVFVADTTYYVIRIAAGTFQLASTAANALATVPVQIEDTADSIGNWSVTVRPGWFKIDPGANEVIVLTSLTFFLYDTKGGLPDEYGDMGAALSTGITLDLKDADTNSVIDFFDGELVTMNAEFERFCDKVETVAGTVNQAYAFKIDFPERYGQELRIVGAPGEFNSYLEVTVTEDMSTLLGHYFMAQGYYESGQLR